MAKKFNVFHGAGWSAPVQPRDEYLAAGAYLGEYLAELISKVWGLPGEAPSGGLAAINYARMEFDSGSPGTAKVKTPNTPPLITDLNRLYSVLFLMARVLQHVPDAKFEAWMRHRVYGEPLESLAEARGVSMRWVRYQVEEIDEELASHVPGTTIQLVMRHVDARQDAADPDFEVYG